MTSIDPNVAPAARAASRLADILLLLLVAYACFYKMWLGSVLPFSVPMSSPHDSTWFFTKAMFINTGQWFGPYNHYTLIKGPVYPMFLSTLSNLGISPRTALDLLYVCASLTFLLALARVLTSRIALFVAFALVLFNPVTLSDVWTYPMRMNLYIILILIYIASLVAIIATACRHPERIAPWWSIVCGVSLALAWNTREESVWLLAMLFPLALVTLWRLLQRRGLIPLSLFWIITLGIPVIAWQAIASTNERTYGFRGTVEFKAPQFNRAMTAVFSLNTAGVDYQYMTEETRDKMEAISPATRELIGRMVNEKGLYSSRLASLSGSNASWRIRSAMNKNGHYESFAQSERAYARIADDIERYCNSEQGACRSMYVPGFILQPVSPGEAVRQATDGFRAMVEFERFVPADNSVDRKRGDATFQYVVDRFFNFKSGFDPGLEALTEFPAAEKKRKSKTRMIYRNYHELFLLLTFVAAAVSALTLFVPGAWPHKMIILCLGGGAAAGFAVYLFISLFAVPHFSRLLASASLPLICFTAFGLALAIEGLMLTLGRVTGLGRDTGGGFRP